MAKGSAGFTNVLQMLKCLSLKFPYFLSPHPDTLLSWLKVSKREFETPTQRPESRPASKAEVEAFVNIK